MVQDMRQRPRFFHAASSEIFGQPAQMPQDENTPYAPVNPYGCAKAFATQMVTIYRKTFGHFAVNGIMFNHESPRRGENFVTRKICRAAAAIKLGKQKDLMLGDTSAKRDWGSARDYVHGMWLSLQHATAEDYIFATGKLHSVQDVVETAFATVNLDWRQHVRKDNRLLRPAEPQRLCGNASKARRLLNWEPATTFRQLIEEMTQAELASLSEACAQPVVPTTHRQTIHG
jgi:GDPmannose 4,6-dehydratase